MRISDWSSDVCSSDLAGVVAGADQFKQVVGLDRLPGVGDQPEHARADRRQAQATLVARAPDRFHETFGIVDVVLWLGTDVPGHALMLGALAAAPKSHVPSLPRLAGEGLIRGDLRDSRVDPLHRPPP